ncbi:ABC transporter substrate-binding protein [Alteromonas lipolytica]|uniref:Peptide ABC transporter substrate-binding protein n=1 Tax=Alteromonas lipolytica TaxID=1856405 RepID=A0A1E8FEF7_9ALTE|nr:ABC transporter substrate-binding protein [Alteromonas lipolytica]OFI34299.1 peptide ABC transporter substrate-binding protein [Alteromonas lipolytica]GGF82675.1 ABC transporter substrate-binding protein [Alteromonas lipolytica]
MNRRSVWTVVSAIVVTLLGGCSPQKYSANYTSGLVYCSESDPISMNPQLDTSTTTADATAHQIYNRLLEFDTETGRIRPSLATKWSISQDGLRYRFLLRQDVGFHSTSYFTPSRLLNAEDVLFSFNRWRLPEHSFHPVSGGYYPYFESLGLADNIADITALSPFEVEITLKQRDSSFLANIASDFSVILSAEYGDLLMSRGTPEKIDRLPIGTGPYQYADYQKNHYIRYDVNEQYWEGTPASESLIFDITPKSSLRLAKLMTGECDAIAFPARVDHQVIRERDDLALDEKAGLNIGFWAFNTERAPFDNPAVRKALAYAIDKNTLIEAVYFDSATRAKSLLPAASWAYQPDAQDTGYNPVLARQLLDQAGIEPGFSMTIWAIPVERAYNPNAQKMAELIQRYLADIEVEVNIVSYDWSTFRRELRRGNHDSVLIGWSADNGDPDNFYRPLLSCDAIPSGTNRARWCNPTYDELLDRALQTEDIDIRKALYLKANELLFDKLPIVPIAHAYRYQAYRKELSGMVINPYGGVRLGGVTKHRD